MKKIYLLLLFVAIGVIGCGKDDSKNPIPDYVGKWQLGNADWFYKKNGIWISETRGLNEPQAPPYINSGEYQHLILTKTTYDMITGDFLEKAFSGSVTRSGDVITLVRPSDDPRTITAKVSADKNFLELTYHYKESQHPSSYTESKIIYAYKRIE